MPRRFHYVTMDESIVMPNHFHGIFIITDKAFDEGTCSLGTVVGAFKSLTTNEYILGLDSEGWQPFDRRLWQRNYYEHIIRDDKDLDRIRNYISLNAARWSEDTENPAHEWRITQKTPSK